MVKLFVQDDGLSTFVGEGEVSPGEILGAYSGFLKSGPTRLVLWDLSSATLARIDSGSVRDLAKCMARLARGRRNDGKSAIACSRAVDFGLARMLTTFLSIEDLPVRFGVFGDLDSARAWLADEVVDP